MTGVAPGQERSGAAAAQRPRDAATLIIVDQGPGGPRVLMGQRRMDQVFMPGKFVFPGGRVDRADRTVESADELPPSEAAKLLLQMRGVPSVARARALALAAVRETFEETGLVIGAPAPAAGAAQRGRPPAWRGFFGCGFRPRLGRLTMLARAITPPGRPRRYDTRFFCVPAAEIGHKLEAVDGELSRLDWLTIEDARRLDLPAITRVILEDLGEFLQALHAGTEAWAVPFYHHQRGSFRRDLLRLGADAQRLDTTGPAAMVATRPAGTP